MAVKTRATRPASKPKAPKSGFPEIILGGNAASSPAQLILVEKEGSIPGGFERDLPAHLKAREHGALKGDRGAKLVIHGSPARVFLGVGAARDFTSQEAAEWGEAIGHFLNQEHLSDVALNVPDSLHSHEVLFNFLKGLSFANFRVDELKSPAPARSPRLERVTLAGSAANALSDADLKSLDAIVKGIAFARTLVELPSNEADPSGIVERFRATADLKKIQLEVWDEKRISKEGMGLLEAVAKGADRPPRVLIARYGKQYASKHPTLCLVGKGITFDTGGVNLKVMPYKELIWMKKDMAGAAAVLGAIQAIAALEPTLHVVAITPLAINALGSRSVLPGDVIRSYSGKTVEIQNTDAEGRLILADAVHLALKEKPDYLIDVATLTGACVVALGDVHSGIFSNQRAFRETVQAATEAAGEPAWPLPMSPRYGEELKSSVADLSNMGKGRDAGATIGAKFIENFVGNVPWVHLDIAGTADLGGPANSVAPAKASGRMVHTFAHLARVLAAKGRGRS